jgi:antitoxin CptB
MKVIVDNVIPPRLHWACRRGMLELDVLLGNFLREAFLNLSTTDQTIFIELLSEEDQDLFMWLTNKELPEDTYFHAMIQQIRQHAQTRHTL